MTPQERELVSSLFDRLATLENQPRDADAERTIIEGLRRAPNATYALVQTALVQDEALRRANARIQELETRAGDAPASQPTGFLDGMRDALLGRPARGGSVPSVRPAQSQAAQPQAQDQSAAFGSAPPWRQAPATGGGSSFLGTAAAAAAGMIGGSLLLDGIRSMMGPGHGAFGIADPAFGAGRDLGSPWDTTGGGDLAREAGINDIGRHQQGGAGLFDNAAADDGAVDPDQDAGPFDDSGSDLAGGDFGGGGDFGSSDA
jgi:uncharacterized protein